MTNAISIATTTNNDDLQNDLQGTRSSATISVNTQPVMATEMKLLVQEGKAQLTRRDDMKPVASMRERGGRSSGLGMKIRSLSQKGRASSMEWEGSIENSQPQC